MMPMRILFAAVALGALAGCYAREPNYRNYGARPHEWDLPGPDYENEVFGPMPTEEVKEFVREKERQGWEVVGYELASLPEEVMVHPLELDTPSKAKRPRWPYDVSKTMDARVDPPKKATIPPYMDEDVRNHRQKYLVVMRRWL